MPILLYNLELTEEEISHLLVLLSMRTQRGIHGAPVNLKVDEEDSILEKVTRLMEGE